MLGCWVRILQREWRLVVAWGLPMLLCNTAGVGVSIGFRDARWYAMGVLLPLNLFFGSLVVWHVVRGGAIPLQGTIRDLWIKAAEEDDAKSRHLRRALVFWFVCLVHMVLGLPMLIILDVTGGVS